VDESGQDTRGKLFVVSVVVMAEERDDLTRVLEQIERETGKGRLKWHKASYHSRLAYIDRVIKLGLLQGRLNFALYRDALNYLELTTRAVINSLDAVDKPYNYKATVLIDALPTSHIHLVGRYLRRSQVRFSKVRGIKRDENDVLIRLSDALCGFVRDAYENHVETRRLFEQAYGLDSGCVV